MVQKTLLTSLLLAILSYGYAQNLVPNYSFETDSVCPDNYNEVTYSKGWMKALNNNDPTYNTDYCNACGISTFSVPSNTWGNQAAASGQAYMAQCTMAPQLHPNYRENIYTKLNTPLVPGRFYLVSFKISHTDNSQNSSNNHGVKFATVPNFPVDNQAHVYSAVVNKNDTSWTTISGAFMADSAYQYIGIGNFFDDAHTISIQSCASCAYNQWGYFLDDICVVQSSNLVPNYSFELDSACPDYYNEVTYSQGWKKSLMNNVPQYNTDYCKTCGTSSFSVPNNTWGSQAAATGNAYMAQCTMAPAVQTDYRENIYTQLTTPLVPGQTYYLQMKVSQTDNSQHSSNNQGLKMATVPGFSVNNIAHLHSTSVITDTSRWTTISGTFVADSAYKYVGVGNFFDDAHTTSIVSCGTCAYSQWGYYVDDIQVVPMGRSCINDVTAVTALNQKAPDVLVYPIPSSGLLHIDINGSYLHEVVLDLTNLEGKQMKATEKRKLQQGNTALEMNIETLPRGVYFLRIVSGQRVTVKKIILAD
jgi:hypothetical protein